MNASLNDAFFRQILESIEDYAVFTTDVSGNITSWNTGAENVLGFTEEEVLGKSAHIIFTEEDIKNGTPEREAAEALAKGRGIDERYHRRKDNSLFWGSGLVFPLHDENGVHIGFTKIMRNLSNRKEAEDQMLEARKYAESIVETSKEPIVILNIDQTINSGSKAFYNLFRLKESEVKNTFIHEALGSCMNTMPLKHQMERYDSFENFELSFVKEGQKEAGVLLASCRKVFRTFNSIGQFLLTFEDVTFQRRMEQAKEDFISIASHELKTPITIIKSYAEILSMELKDQVNERVNNTLERIQSQADQLAKLTSFLLDASEFRSGTIILKKETFVLLELLLGLIKEIGADHPSHKIVVENVTDVKVTADRDRIGQVITNLLTNAIKYSPDSDNVVVNMETDMQNRFVRILIRDEGIGIAPENREMLFKRFSRITDSNTNTRRIEGFGMGLYISSEIVQAHGGQIDVMSNGTDGSTFYFDLPF
jgi:PAS domain S-box-containing protein